MHAIPNRILGMALAAAIIGLALSACAKPSAQTAAATTPASATSNAVDRQTATPADDPDNPCRLLTDAEVRAVFPGTKTGERERSREEYGITACQWSGRSGDFLAEVWKAKDSTARDEIHSLAAGFIDPLNAAADNNLRYEAITGVGDQAYAVVEAKDDQRGILTDVALLVVREGDRILVLISPDLARSDRGRALAALQSLGRTAANRF